MSDPRRVFITGLSALTASGNSLEQTWEAMLSGNSAIKEINAHDLSHWPNRLGGELEEFNPAKSLPDRKLIKVISRQDAIGINAAVQAIEHSKVIGWRDSSCQDLQGFNESMGVYVGSPGNKYFQQYDFLPLIAKSGDNMQTFAEQLFSEVHPMWLLRILPNNVLAYVGITYGFKGANHNVTNHAVGGMQALIEAAQAIKSGQIERAVVVAYDMGTEPQALFYYDKMGLISPTGLRPFAFDHDGTVLAEGGAALVLESEASVMQRNATCYGEIVAMGSQTEGCGLFSIEENGEHLARLLENTLCNHHVPTTDVDLVVAHGNGNPRSDCSEAKALGHVFADRPSIPLLTAFKWAMGHTLTASGVLDTVLACTALNEQRLPGIPNFTAAAPDCSHLRINANTQSLQNVETALIINRGFASMNSCLVVKACD